MENHVTNYELSKRLKALGVPQGNSFYYWCETNDNRQNAPATGVSLYPADAAHARQYNAPYLKTYAAFLASELGEYDAVCHISRRTEDGVTMWHAFTTYDRQQVAIAKTLPDALGEMLAYLRENGLIKLEGKHESNS